MAIIICVRTILSALYQFNINGLHLFVTEQTKQTVRTMKNSNRIIVPLFVLLLFTACSSISSLTMGVTEPARVPIPQDVLRVGIINRSIPSEGNNALDKIDKILTLEGLNLDKEGAEASVTGLKDELSRIKRFDAITIIDSIDVQRKGLGVFPAALSWESIDEICKAHNVDVIFSLELYDTNTNFNYDATIVNIPNSFGIKANIPGHRVTLRTTLKNGWRVYDPRSKLVLDEFVYNEAVVSVGEGINPMKAIEAVVGRKEAVLELSTGLGNLYALKIRPLRTRVRRNYFVRGTDNFEIGQRRAQAGDWNGAAELWEKDLDHPDAKIAGRAHYNMAIINEINGDLNQAIEYASRSYTDYNNRDALRYINILRYRQAEQSELDRQLSR